MDLIWGLLFGLLCVSMFGLVAACDGLLGASSDERSAS